MPNMMPTMSATAPCSSPAPARQAAPGVRAAGEGSLPGTAAPRSAADDARFRAMVDAHFDAVWRTLRGLGVRDGAADDAAQHVFLVALQKLARIEAGSERSFLLGTAVGVAANARRSVARSRESTDSEALLAQVDPGPDPEQQAVLRERQEQLAQVLETMPDELRTVFVLFELEGLTSIEIGAALEIPSGTATSRLRRAREHFRAQAARLPDAQPRRDDR